MLGIISSAEIEAALILEQLKEKKELRIQGKFFCKGILKKNIETVICICGIGKANAAHGTALLIERFKPNFIYIIGIAGAYPSSKLNIGDIAIAEKEIYGDEGLIVGSGVRKRKEMFHSMDELNLPLAKINREIYYNEFPMFMPKKFKIQDSRFKIQIGNFVTVSTCTGILKRGKEIEKRLNALCENMEGAAIAHICLFSKIRAAEIRGISNIIEDRMAEPLKKSNIIKAAENAQRFFLEQVV